MELPPHTRRIPDKPVDFVQQHGTTSAYAENTPCEPDRATLSWNYLRVRGEYITVGTPDLLPEELPPRARRIPVAVTGKPGSVGTTSACAENTHHESHPRIPHRNYLRVRGEYPGQDRIHREYRELPPRARRIPLGGGACIIGGGTTSACAENTGRFAGARQN